MQYDPVALNAMTSLRQLRRGDLADYVIGSWGAPGDHSAPDLDRKNSIDLGPDILIGRIAHIGCGPISRD
jgi:hypothetical protein